jgi:hypothetical protein
MDGAISLASNHILQVCPKRVKRCGRGHYGLTGVEIAWESEVRTGSGGTHSD